MNKLALQTLTTAFLLHVTGICLSQNIGIGTFTPNGKLHVKGNADTSQLVVDANATQGSVPIIRLRSATGRELMRIHGDSTNNLLIGFEAGKNINTNRLNNVFIGSWSGHQTNTGQHNTAVGTYSLDSNTSGSYNTALGIAALLRNDTGSYNTAVGGSALGFNNSHRNTAVGHSALGYNTSGYYNTAIGMASMVFNNTGNSNVAVGYTSMRNNTTAISNTAVGKASLYYNESGSENVAIGSEALYNAVSSQKNTAVGYRALHQSSIGGFNSAFGESAALNTTTGNFNVAIGNYALMYNATGSNNIAIGANAGTHSCCQFSNTISIGNDNYRNGWHNQVFLGNLLMTVNAGNVPWSTFSDERIKTKIDSDVKGLDFIMRLRPVTYYRNINEAMRLTGNTDRTGDYAAKYEIEKIKFTGFLAQEVEAVARQIDYDFSGVQAPKNSGQLYSLSYETFVVPLVKAVQEQQQMIEELKKDLRFLQKQNGELSSKLAALELKK